jgi:hypothetical protein
MMYELMLRDALKKAFSWRLIAKEIIGIGMVWAVYFMYRILFEDSVTTDMAPSWTNTLFEYLFWPTVVISVISFTMASIKSLLPAAIALGTAMVLFLLEYNDFARNAFYLANGSVLLFGIGFVLYTDRGCADNRY